MKQIGFFVFCIFTLFSCNQENNVKYTYYESGKIKEKIIYKTPEVAIAYLYSEGGKLQKIAELKNGLLDGVCRSYFSSDTINEEIYFKNGKKNGRMLIYNPNGKVKMTRTYLNDTLHGITQLFNAKGDIKQDILYIKGKQVLYNEYFENREGTFLKMVNYILDSNNNLKPSGQIVLNKRNNNPIKDMSFYYILNKERDTINLNEANTIKLEFVNKLNWRLEVQVGRMDESLNFISNPEVYHSNDNKIKFSVKADRKGWYLLTGKLIVLPKEQKNRNDRNEFIFYSDFFVRD